MRRLPFALALAVLLFAFAVMAEPLGHSLPEARAEEAPPVDFALQDAKGRTRRLADFRGKVVVVTFGYVNCPDVCPMTLAVLSQAMKALGPEAKRVQVVFISVDPERDTARLLGMYPPAFDKTFIGLRGSAKATAKAAELFDVDFRKQPGKESASYTVDHTAASYIVDPAGTLRVVVAYGQGPEVFEKDIRHLLRFFPAK
jgi:protein SCO1/2